MTGWETREELVARIKQLEKDNREIATIYESLRAEKQDTANERHTMKMTIARLEGDIERYQEREEERRQRRLDRKKMKMLEGLS